MGHRIGWLTGDIRCSILLKFDLTSLDTGTYYGNANLKLKAVAGDFLRKRNVGCVFDSFREFRLTENGATWNTIDGVTSWAGPLDALLLELIIVLHQSEAGQPKRSERRQFDLWINNK